MSDSVTHGLQPARLPCPSPTPGACSNSYPLSRWCHPTILSSVFPFSSCFPSFPASGYFPRSQFFPSGGQSIEVSMSASILTMNTQDWFPLDGLVGSPCSPRDFQESSPTTQFKSISFSVLSFLYGSTLIFIYLGLPLGSVGKASACNAGDAGSIPGSGNSPQEAMPNLSSILVRKIPWGEVLAGCSP